jgi:dUTP pyrophosphatase
MVARSRRWKSRARLRPAIDAPPAEAIDRRMISSTHLTIGVVRLPHGAAIDLPAYETAGAAGMDLRAAVPEDRPLLILPGKRALAPTGLILEIPDGYEGQIRPRSGLAFRHGVTCLNTPGTIDSDYRGEVQVLLANLGEDIFSVSRGMRIAQIVFAAVARAAIEERSLAGGTERGAGGFGSTGTG